MSDVVLVQLPQVPGVYSRLFKQYEVLLHKISLLVNQCQVYLPHNGVHLIELFEVQVCIDGLTVQIELAVDYLFIIPPHLEHEPCLITAYAH